MSEYEFTEFLSEEDQLLNFDDEALVRTFSRGKILQHSFRKKESYFPCIMTRKTMHNMQTEFLTLFQKTS